MHELSIACSIVEMVEESLPTEETRVKKVFVKIGKLSGIVKEPLLFSFDIAAEGTQLEGANLEIEEVNVVIHCDKCNIDTELDNPPIFRCIDCGESTANILRGKEMDIISVEIEDGKTESS